MTLKSFTLTECANCSVELDNGKTILPSCRQWRIVINEVEWTGESEEDWHQLAENAGFPAPLSVILSPVVLAASTRINSVHNSNLSPTVMLHSEFKKFSVKFIFLTDTGKRALKSMTSFSLLQLNKNSLNLVPQISVCVPGGRQMAQYLEHFAVHLMLDL